MKRLLLLAVAVVALMGSSARPDAYIISTGDNLTYKAASSIDQLQATRKRLTGRYMWVRRGGLEYVIRDEATIARVEAFFARVDALGPEQEAVSREEAKLDHEADRLSDKDRLSPAEETRLRELHERLRVMSQRERELDRKDEELEREAERALWTEVDSAIGDGTAKPTAATRR
jgi:predicted RNase H-like nuclease (RuvC/YqgF family)